LGKFGVKVNFDQFFHRGYFLGFFNRVIHMGGCFCMIPKPYELFDSPKITPALNDEYFERFMSHES